MVCFFSFDLELKRGKEKLRMTCYFSPRIVISFTGLTKEPVSAMGEASYFAEYTAWRFLCLLKRKTPRSWISIQTALFTPGSILPTKWFSILLWQCLTASDSCPLEIFNLKVRRDFEVQYTKVMTHFSVLG